MARASTPVSASRVAWFNCIVEASPWPVLPVDRFASVILILPYIANDFGKKRSERFHTDVIQHHSTFNITRAEAAEMSCSADGKDGSCSQKWT